MPKFTRRHPSANERQSELLAEVGVAPVRRSILIELAEVGVFENADQLTRSALAEQFGISLDQLDEVVARLEQISQDYYRTMAREPVDAAMASDDLVLAEEGLASFVMQQQAAEADPDGSPPG